MHHIEAELAEATDEEALAELMDEYGRLQHRFEALGGFGLEAEARRILAGLGFAETDMERSTEEFSGGWRMRAALARLLLQIPDLLLLDEPSNHLDLASVEWLQGFLAEFAGAVLLISHDRDFINAVVNRVAELNHGLLTEYPGDYADFVDQREERIAQLSRGQGAGPQDRADRALHRALPLQDDQGAPGPEPHQAAGPHRARGGAERTPQVGRSRFPPAAQRPGGGSLDRIVKRYGRHSVYDGLDLQLERGQKVALIGPNGAGKSTLLKLLAGVLPFEGGEPGARPERARRLLRAAPDRGAQPANTVFDELSAVAPAHVDRGRPPPPRRLPLLRRRGRQAGGGPLRRRADPPGPGAADGRSAQPPLPRRADQPPGHRFPRGPGRRPARLFRHPRADHP